MGTANKQFVATTKRIALPTSMEIDLVVEETNSLTGELQDRTITVAVALPKAWTTSSTMSAASSAVPSPPPTLKAFNVRFIHPVSRPRSQIQQQQQQQHQQQEQTKYLQQLQQQQQQRVQHKKQPNKRKNRTFVSSSSWPLPSLHSKLPSSPSLITRHLQDRFQRKQSQPQPHQEKMTSQRPPGRAVFLPPRKKLKTTMSRSVPDDDNFITRNQKIINSILDQPEQKQKGQLQQQQKSHLYQRPQHPTTQFVGTTTPNALYYPNHQYPAALPFYRNTNTKHNISSTIVVDGSGAPVSSPPATNTGTSSMMLPFSLSVSSLPTSITDDIDIVASLLALPHQPPPAARVSQCSP